MDLEIAKETGRTARSFFQYFKEQPLTLALVVMNLILLFFLFYSGASQLEQRKETVDLIVTWQRETDKVLASCVSKEVVDSIIGALERDRELYREMLRENKPSK